MPRWSFWLRDLPATIVDGWFLAYRLVLLISTIIAVSTVCLALALYLFGIRWGW